MLHAEQSRPGLRELRARRHPSERVDISIAPIGDIASAAAAAAEPQRGGLPEAHGGSRHLGTGDRRRHALLNTRARVNSSSSIYVYRAQRRGSHFSRFLYIPTCIHRMKKKKPPERETA